MHNPTTLSLLVADQHEVLDRAERQTGDLRRVLLEQTADRLVLLPKDDPEVQVLRARVRALQS